MSIIDTHTHIYDSKFDADIHEVIAQAKKVGVKKVLLPNIDLSTIDNLQALVLKYPEYCFPMMGLHPTSVTLDWKKDLEQIKQLFNINKYIAVGEIGIDLYWDTSLKKEQISAFEEQLKWSIEYNLPVSIHARKSIDEVIQSIKKIGENQLRGVFHSFDGNEEELNQILALDNFYIGINGIITYKNSTLPKVIKQAPLSRIVIETDAPYLPPVPHRGKRNEPQYTTLTANKLASVFKTTQQIVEEVTTTNAECIFSLT